MATDPPSLQGDEMVVQNSIDQRSEDVNGRDENEQAPSRVLQKIRNVDGQHKKKSSFQITGVYPAVKSGLDPDGDSLDDLDETAETHTEDVSSDILDISKTTDIDPDPSSTEEISTPNHLTNDESPGREVTSLNLLDGEQNGNRDKDMSKDLQSRFKVVKIESTEPFRRGRWICHDYMAPSKDGEKKEKGEKGEKDEGVGSGNSSAASSIHYIHGVDDPAKNPLGGTIIHSDGHPIVEPQPIYPTTTQGQGLNGDYTAQQNQSQTTGQGMVLQESSAAGTVPQGGYQAIGQGIQNQSNGTSTQMQQMVGQNGVPQSSANVHGTVQPSEASAQNQDFMTRSQEFVSQSQDYLAQQTEYSTPATQLTGGQTSGEVATGQTPKTQNAQLPQTQLPAQDSLGVQPAQNSNLGEYNSQQGQANPVPANVATSNASPSNENLNVNTSDVAAQDSSFNTSAIEDAGGTVQRMEASSSNDPDTDTENRAPEGAVVAPNTTSSSAVPAAANGAAGGGTSGTAQDLLTPPLLEMVSGMRQSGGIVLSRDGGDER